MTGAGTAAGREPVTVSVVGCGHVSRHDYLPLLAGSPHTRVVALCDADRERAAECAAEFGVGPVSDNVGQCLNETPSELVVNLTPPALHNGVTLDALRAGRHVYSEKPLAMSVSEATDTVALAQERGLRLDAAPYVRDSPVVHALAALVRGGELGHVHTATARYGAESSMSRAAGWRYGRENGGALFDLGVYPVALLRTVLGEPVRLSAHGDVLRPRLAGTGAEQQAGPLAADNTVLTLDFGQGTSAVVQTGFWYGAHPFLLQVELLGEAGAARIAGEGNLMATALEVNSPATGGRWERREVELGDYHWAGGPVRMAADLRTGRAPDHEGTEALRVLRLLTAVEQAAAERSWIDVDDDPTHETHDMEVVLR
ncbi:Gfo/Idh/MocA family protein [Streptomyces chrestomyceticus]|uniref:Gfo/Idh/MocA family protein n=1 Tax=Streptomyces chrestomyceticus TaxID=68185 RepID=UPI0033E75B87